MANFNNLIHKTGFFLLGELVEFGDTDDIFTDPHDERTERYISRMPGLTLGTFWACFSFMAWK